MSSMDLYAQWSLIFQDPSKTLFEDIIPTKKGSIFILQQFKYIILKVRRYLVAIQKRFQLLAYDI